MVFNLLKLGQKSQEEEFSEKMKEEMAARKSSEKAEEKTENFQEFLKTPEAAKLITEWKKKGFTRRGLVKLMLILHPMYKSNKGIVSAAKDILSSLKGEDGLSRVLGVLKLVPEGIMKGMK
jgi:hypothetical protein